MAENHVVRTGRSLSAWPDDGQLPLTNRRYQSFRLLPRPSPAPSSHHPSPWEISQAAASLVVSFSPFVSRVRRIRVRPFFLLPVRSNKSQSYEPLLLENEREAVADLLQFLESTQDPSPEYRVSRCSPPTPDRTNTNFFSGPPLTALTTLSFSDNVDLQRSAALAFAEITEKEVRPVGRETLDPILFLLSSHDTEVQRAASAALGNLAVNSTFSVVML